MIQVKSICAELSDDDGFRVSVEPAWPRKAGHKKATRNICLRDLAPGLGLNDRYSSNMVRGKVSLPRYHEELDRNRKYFRDLQVQNHTGRLTLVHGSRNKGRNTAVARRMLLKNDGVTL